MNDPIIKLDGVSFTYDMEKTPALNNLTLNVEAGEWVAITGRSGSGKSALCQLLNGYLPRIGGGRREGTIFINGIDPAESGIAEIAERIGVVFQDPDAQLVQGRVEDEVAFAPENLRVPPAAVARRVDEALAAVNLTELRGSSVHALSGGQRQRTGIAAVLSMQTPILVFDDAAASLDRASREQLLTLLRGLHAQGRTLLTVSSRVDEIAAAAGRLVVLEGGTVSLDGPAAVLLRTHRCELAQLGVLPPLEAEAQPPEARAAGAAAAAGLALGGPPAGQPAAAGTAGLQPIVPPAAAAACGSTPQQQGRAMQAEPLLALRGLTFRYPGSAEPALYGVSLSLHAGEWALLCGENGSGKTTLSRLLMNLLPVPRGTCYWEGRDISRMKTYELAEGIGYLFQEPEHQFVTSSVMEEMLYEPKLTASAVQGEDLPEAVMERASRLLMAAGLKGREAASPYLLSGGEKRLLGAAAQFMTPKKLYILDEPTAGTDYAGVQALIKLCREASREGAAMLVITHEPQRFAQETDKVFTLNHGELMNTLQTPLHA